MLLQCRECTNMTVQIYRHIGATYMDVVFPYKEAITNAYGLIGHTTTHVVSQSFPMSKGEKAKGHSTIATLW